LRHIKKHENSRTAIPPRGRVRLHHLLWSHKGPVAEEMCCACRNEHAVKTNRMINTPLQKQNRSAESSGNSQNQAKVTSSPRSRIPQCVCNCNSARITDIPQFQFQRDNVARHLPQTQTTPQVTSSLSHDGRQHWCRVK
jgi:hypothetical protein